MKIVHYYSLSFIRVLNEEGRRPAVVGTRPDDADAQVAPAPGVRRRGGGRGVIPADAGGPPRRRYQAKD